MNLKLELEFSKADIFKQVDDLKKQLDEMRPLPADVEGRVMQKLRLDWNYNSNAIEGNKLSYGETESFLMTGITVKGKPLKDYLDIRGHNEAILFLTSIVKDNRPLTESDLRALHEMILVEPYEVKAQTADGTPTKKFVKLGEYKTSPNHVQTVTGEMHYYTSPEETQLKMQELMEWYIAAIADSGVHPVVIAARFHHKFVAIHPFDDGNGRLSRVLMNLVLMKYNYPPAIIKMDDRQNYYSLLSQADAGDNWPFIEYIAERAKASLQLYLKAIKGGDIEEDEDIDKEIALFKMELDSRINVKQKKTVEEVKVVVIKSILPLIDQIKLKIKEFETYFQEIKSIVYFKVLDPESIVAVRNNEKRIFSKQTWDLLGVNKEGFTLSLGESYKRAIVLTSNNLETIQSTILTDKNFNEISFIISLNKFKEEGNDFDITVDLYFRFKDTEYNISDYKEQLLYKSYDQQLSSKDSSLIIKAVINDIKDLMSYNFE